MATVSAVPSQRPKKMVRYGKAASRSTWNTTHLETWLDDDREEHTIVQREAVVKTTYSARTVDEEPGQASVAAKDATVETHVKRAKKKADHLALPTASGMEVASHEEADTPSEPSPKRAKLSTSAHSPASITAAGVRGPVQDKTLKTKRAQEAKVGKLMAKRERSQNIFDVPSDEEAESSIALRHASPGWLKPRRNLVDDTPSVTPQEVALAPWEKSKGSSEQAPSPGKQMQDTLQKNVDHAVVEDMPVARDKPSPATAVVPKKQEPLSAAARLALRRKAHVAATAKTQPVPQRDKRTDATASAAKQLPKKRTRTSPAPQDNMAARMKTSTLAKVTAEDVIMVDGPSLSASSTPQVSSPPSETVPPTPHRNARRTAVSQLRSTPRKSPQKGLSAPARLIEMLPVDVDGTDQGSSPSAFQSPTFTPKRSITPAAASTPSSKASPRPTGGLTPKQAQLWSQLLPSDPPVPTPTTTAMRDLTLSGRRRKNGRASTLRPALTVSQSDVTGAGRRRTRLVDRLKASAPSSDVEASDEDDSDVEMADVAGNNAERDPQLALVQTEASQSQSQSQATEMGPRITYGQTRSYLPEDNFEDSLLFDLPAITPQRPTTLPRQPSKTTQKSQKSGFDLDDSEDDSQGRMRTVHELRAAGRNNRFAQEVEGLLDDMAERGSSARGRRRSALVELGTKLLDDDFAGRFLAAGFESRLFAEVGAVDDVIADFLLASTMALLLCAEMQEHTIFALKDANAITWLSAMLSIDNDVCKLVKDRQQNMAKATQATVVEYAKKLQSHCALWQTMTASPRVTPRGIALRALDTLISKLRRLGDRSELLDVKQLLNVLPATSLQKPASADTSSAIAVLEALSSSASTMPWPAGVVERIAALISALGADDAANNHAFFLALRLTLNLTNDNARNCGLFSQPATIQHLLQAIASGFTTLLTPPATAAEDQVLPYDLLVLAMGCMINLAEHSSTARELTITPASAPTTSTLLKVFIPGQNKMEEAESLTETNTNVAYGYLAVMLANLCLSTETREFVAAALPGKNLRLLVEAVDEFVRHHERVDGLGDGVEGREVWGAFTEKLRGVLAKLKGVVGGGL